eukprot:758784-Hanusia_phi.AAC.5
MTSDISNSSSSFLSFLSFSSTFNLSSLHSPSPGLSCQDASDPRSLFRRKLHSLPWLLTARLVGVSAPRSLCRCYPDPTSSASHQFREAAEKRKELKGSKCKNRGEAYCRAKGGNNSEMLG